MWNYRLQRLRSYQGRRNGATVHVIAATLSRQIDETIPQNLSLAEFAWDIQEPSK